MASRPHIHLNNIATVTRAGHKNSPHTHYTRRPSARSDSVLGHILLGTRALVETLFRESQNLTFPTVLCPRIQCRYKTSQAGTAEGETW